MYQANFDRFGALFHFKNLLLHFKHSRICLDEHSNNRQTCDFDSVTTNVFKLLSMLLSIDSTMPEPEVHFIGMLGMLQVPTANPKFLEQALGLLPKLSLLCDDVLNASRTIWRFHYYQEHRSSDPPCGLSLWCAFYYNLLTNLGSKSRSPNNDL